MSSMPSQSSTPAAAEPAVEPATGRRPWPYPVAVVAVPFLVFGFAGLAGRLVAALVLTVAAVAIAVRIGEAAGAAGSGRAAARQAELRARRRP